MYDSRQYERTSLASYYKTSRIIFRIEKIRKKCFHYIQNTYEDEENEKSKYRNSERSRQN